MRRISLALALVGAVAAGCGGAGSTATSNNQKRGVEGTQFTLTIRGETQATVGTTVYMLPAGGIVTAAGGIDCGIPATGAPHTACSAKLPFDTTTPVVVTATNNGGTGVHAFAGACSGQGACSFLMDSDRFVAVRFAADSAGLGAHPNFSDGNVHAAEYAKWAANNPQAYHCTDCHGAQGQGAGLAPSCSQCHAAPPLPPVAGAHAVPWSSDPTVAAAAHGAAYVASGATSAPGPTCGACHTATGMASAKLCDSCHAMPHDTTAAYGAYPNTHFVDYYTEANQAAGTANCFGCHHGLNFTGADTSGLAAGAPFQAPACFSCHSTFNHNSYTHPAAYEGEFWSGGRTSYGTTPGSFATTYNLPTLAGALPQYGSYKAGASTWEPNCVGCHGTTAPNSPTPPGLAAAEALAGYPNGAPSCDECHYKPPMPEVLGDALSNHFTATKEAWALYSFSQACERCHTAGGFKDYVGVDGVGQNLMDSFNISSVGPAGTYGMANGGYNAGPLPCDTCHNPVTDPSRDGLHGAYVTGLTTIEFPSLIKVGGIDKGRALCGTCHQARQATANLVNAIASKWNVAKGLTYASLSANAAGSTTTFLYKNLVMASIPTPVAADVGYTAIFNGNATAALNGARAIVQSVVVGGTNTTVTFASTLPAAPTNAGWVACVVASGTTTTCMTAVGGSTPVTAPATGWAKTADSAIFYPTATGGSTTSLIDANRNWTNDFTGSYVFFQTGLNAGKYAAITSNTTTQLNFASTGLSGAVASGDFYQIVPETSLLADEMLMADASHATTVSTNNPHYLGAVATEYGAVAAGWYQFPGKSYRTGITHTHLSKNVYDPETGVTVTVERAPNGIGTAIKVASATCVDCHDAHTLELNQNACVGCHNGLTATSGAAGTNMATGKHQGDFDCSGHDTGVKDEIESLKGKLKTALVQYSKLVSTPAPGTISLGNALDGSGAQTYAGTTSTADFYAAGVPICFDNATNAYWFIGSSNDLTPASDGGCYDGSGNAVVCCASKVAWGAKVYTTTPQAASTTMNPLATGMTPRLYRATYNYKFAMKDPGAWAHNPRYVAQVLIDTITDLNAGITALGGTPVVTQPQSCAVAPETTKAGGRP
jgi:hypothetical protein